jgi:hypothetical protein
MGLRRAVPLPGAAAQATGSALAVIDPADRGESLFLITLPTGVPMLAAGLLRLGRPFILCG